MLHLLTEIADRYTEEPHSKPELAVYHFIARIADRVQA